MGWPASLGYALKEWASVCRAMEQGRQIVLLRKGGIYESSGEFELEHREFLLFETYLHQKTSQLKPAEHAAFEARSEEPQTIRISAAAAATDIVRLESAAQMQAIDDQHVWTAPLIDMRFKYRPENPLYLILARVYRLAAPVSVQNTIEYAGCKSWVPLAQEIATEGARAVLDDAAYEARRADILRRIKV